MNVPDVSAEIIQAMQQAKFHTQDHRTVATAY